MFLIVDNRRNVNGDKMKKFVFLIFTLLIVGCASAPAPKGFTKQEFPAKTLKLTGYVKKIKAGEKLRVYIDGNASTVGIFNKSTKLAHPVAAELAQKDPYPYILYLNRPCYFDDKTPQCQPVVWEQGKYVPEVVDEIKSALDRLQNKYTLSELELVGYDGGAAIALLVATRIKSIPVSVYTFGGILDTKKYALLTDEELYSDSLKPVYESYLVARIPQVHFVGGKDKQTPLFLAKDFAKKIKQPVSLKIKSYPSADHFNWAMFKIELD